MINSEGGTMKIRDVFEQLNTRLLWRLAEENAWPFTFGEAEAPLDEIAAYIKDARTIEKTWQVLSREEKEVWLHFLFRVGEDIVTYRQMEEYAKAVSPIVAYAGLTGLRRRGLIYTLRRLWGEVVYLAPYDVQRAWRAWLLPRVLSETQAISVDAEFQSVTPLVHVLFRLLQTHRHKPIALTKKKTMTMKMRRVWQAVIPYAEEWFAPLYPEACGDGAARERFFLELLAEMDLLRERESETGLEYIVHETAAARLFHGAEADVQRRVYQQVKEKLVRLGPCNPVILDWMEAKGVNTFSLNELQAAENRLLREKSQVNQSKHWQVFAENICPLLTAFGFISRTGEGMDASMRWNMNLTANEENAVANYGIGYVQPTFEVLLLPHASYEVRWRLGRYAELVEQQEVWVFRLTRQSVRAVKGEEENEALIRLLEQIQLEVPDNVRVQLEQWMRSEPSVMLEQVVLVRCPDAETAQQLAALPEFAPYWRARIGEKDFIVDASQEAALREAFTLREININQKSTAKEPSEAGRFPSHASHSIGLAENGYKIESVFPAFEDVLPELKDVPTIWYKNFQRYHHSTLRTLLMTARSLGIRLKLEINNRPIENARVLDIRAEGGAYRLTLDAEGRMENINMENVGRIKLELPALWNED
ncbi:hypothetical protein P4S83_10210 [Aneurinibacillus thermoaerophilus]|uniref:helicase-associated domain-containing protein n=1 Tax=Aneurinibacillus thermoaerophilus TaxID=143495 RepID=UPI002E23E829|nr:hypothetical protein [Aneurinibacillus thermoaerophilus]MED0763663.1 hypothetical protein [Aneurinibacillus thermoaerophilus]